jgi:hypothetical protein
MGFDSGNTPSIPTMTVQTSSLLSSTPNFLLISLAVLMDG